MIMLKCDRCKKPFEFYSIFDNYYGNRTGVNILIQGVVAKKDYTGRQTDDWARKSKLDLCEDCYRSFNEWFESGKGLNDGEPKKVD